MEKQRLQRKIEKLEEKWNLLTEKLSKLERSKILATDPNVIFRLKQEITDTNAERQQIEEQLKKLETELNSKKEDVSSTLAGNAEPKVEAEPLATQKTQPERPESKTEPEQPKAKPPSKQTPGVPVIRLRSEPLTVSEDEAYKVFRLKRGLWANLTHSKHEPLEYIKNAFEDQGETVVDHATGLMWQKSGSKESLTYKKAQEYVEELNRQKFVGYDDWRLPTVEELMSLLEPKKQPNSLYINPIFDTQQQWCWSADRRSSSVVWSVYFINGRVYLDGVKLDLYVRVVRS